MYQITFILFIQVLCFHFAAAESVYQELDPIVAEDLEIGLPGAILTSDVVVQSGSTLTIKAGAKMIMHPKVSLIISPGAKIFAQGTVSNPIVFKAFSDSATIDAVKSGAEPPFLTSLAEQDDWGQLIVCGSAPSLETTFYKSVECGGSNENDFSGELKNVRLERGAGLVLAGVGSQTIVNRVEASFSKGNGITVDGGTVNMKYVSAVYNRNAGFQFLNGYSGRIQFIFSVSQNEVDSLAIQSSGNRTLPMVYSGTILGSPSNDYLLRIDTGAGGEYGNLIMLYSGVHAIYHDCSNEHKVGQSYRYIPQTDSDYTFFSNLNTVWNENQSFQNAVTGTCEKLKSALIIRSTKDYNPNLVAIPLKPSSNWPIELKRVIDPRPIPNKNAYQTSVDAIAQELRKYSNVYFTAVDYSGAFSQDLWLSNLSALDEMHKLPVNSPFDDVLCGSISSSKSLNARKYYLTCTVIIEPGTNFNIGSGVDILAFPNDQSENPNPIFLIVRPQGKLVTQGKSIEFPITFSTIMSSTYTDTVKSHGLWGGIVILGTAPIDGGIDTLDLQDQLENVNDEHLGYGGVVIDHDAGVLQGTRIWHAGAHQNIGALVLAGVGTGSTVSNIEVAFSGNKGLDVRGGSVNLTFISSVLNRGWAFQVEKGYRGTIEQSFALVMEKGGMNVQSVRENHNGATNQFLQTYPKMNHITIFGNEKQVNQEAVNNGPMLKIETSAGGEYRNFAILDSSGNFDGVSIDDCMDSVIQDFMMPNATEFAENPLYFSKSNVISLKRGENHFSNDCSLQAVTDGNPNLNIGCDQLGVSVVDSENTVIELSASSFDPRPMKHHNSKLLTTPLDTVDEHGNEYSAIGAFGMSLWLKDLSWLDIRNLINPLYTFGTTLYQCTTMPTASPTPFPTGQPTQYPTTRPTERPSTNSPTTNEEHNNIQHTDETIAGEENEGCGVFCVFVALFGGIGILLLSYIAFQVKNRPKPLNEKHLNDLLVESDNLNVVREEDDDQLMVG